MRSTRRSIAPRGSTSTSTQQIPPPSTLGHEKVAPPPSRITQYKWIEIQNDENTNLIVNSIREEIIQKAMNTLYTDYLIKRSCSFVVSCAHTAWIQLFNWMHLKRDPGESAMTVKERWTSDEEHPSVPKDNWSFGNVEIRKRKSSLTKQKICKEPCDQEDISRILPENITQPFLLESSGEINESVVAKVDSTLNKEESMQPVYRQDNEEVLVVDETVGGDEEESANEYEAGKSSHGSEALSIFTKTIRMPKHELPIPRWSGGQNQPALRGNDVVQRKNLRSWKLDSVKTPRKLSLDRLPENRLNVRYVPIADQRVPSISPEDTKKRGISKIPPRKSKEIRPRRESKNNS